MANLIRFGFYFTFLFACCLSCSTDTGNVLSSYYFPMQHLVYAYTANDSSGVEYWEIQPDDNQQLVTSVFDGHGTLLQASKEKMYSNGINLERLTLYTAETPVDANVRAGFIFPFEKLDSNEVALYRISWPEVDVYGDTVTYEVIRNRRFLTIDSCEVFGKTTSCAVFRLDEQIISDIQGSVELNIIGEEWYAKDIGLILRYRQANAEMIFETRLLGITSASEFDEVSLKHRQ